MDLLSNGDTGEEKVKKICEVIKEETLEPAKKEAQVILAKAQEEASRLIRQAHKEVERIAQDEKKRLEEDRSIFESSIHLACKKTLETLRQEIEEKLFNEELSHLFKKEMQNPHLIADLINAVVQGLEREGIDANLQAIIPSKVSAKEVNARLAQGILDRLTAKSVQLGEITGGAEVKVVDQHMTLEVSDEALKHLVASYVRDDFRSIVFQS
ncbi:MAG: V-type ATP synthase subunit E [Simkania negevensis]|nr:V-type ATP synthase subunit E [Simkania negevensis]